MLFGCSVMLFSCDDPNDVDPPAGDTTDDDEGKDDEDIVDPPSSGGAQSTIIVPEYKDYGRGTQDFNALSYERPAVDELCREFEMITEAINANEISLDEQIGMIKALEDDYASCKTMYAMAEIFTYRDSSVERWSNEFEYMSTAMPSLSKAIEDMYVAAAQSVHAEQFEEKYFGPGLKDKYADGGKYTDDVVELLEEEAGYVSDYYALSTDTIEITYAGQTGTLDQMIEAAAKAYREGSSLYESLVSIYNEKYYAAYAEKSAEIYVSLLKTRRQIADAMEYSSYIEVAYEDRGYDYSASKAEAFLEDISNYIIPVYAQLNKTVFQPYFTNYRTPAVGREKLLNALYTVYKSKDAGLSDAYSYMLQHGLYDVKPASKNRYEGAFTTYLYSNNSPYLFVSMTEYVSDYSTLAHEFGHFYDNFVNSKANPSLELAEVSSQALELMTMEMLKGEISDAAYNYLRYLSYSSALEVLMYQGFYALFEHMAYSLSYAEISYSSVEELVADASEAMFDHRGNNTMRHVMIPHIIISPMYVQSYCTSVIPALEIYFMEVEDAGGGLEVYKALVNRTGSPSSAFVYNLSRVGLGSPFDEGAVKDIANKMYYHIYGKNYFTDAEDDSNAA